LRDIGRVEYEVGKIVKKGLGKIFTHALIFIVHNSSEQDYIL